MTPEANLKLYTHRGDQAALGAVVAYFTPLVYGMALQRSGRAELAVEIAHSFFMKPWILLPTLVLVSGAVLLLHQRSELSRLRTESTSLATTPEAAGLLPDNTKQPNSPDASSAASAPPLKATRAAATVTGPGHAGAEPSPAEAGSSITLASLTNGAEKNANLRTDNKVLLAGPIALRVMSLPKDSIAPLFARVTALLGSIRREELEAGRCEDPEKMRAMLLLFPLMSRIQREDPARLLDWIASPGLPEFFKDGAGNFAEATMQNFAKSDPTAALTWFDQHRNMPEAGRVEAAALQGLAYQDVNAALREAGAGGILREASAAMIPTLTSSDARRAWSDAVMTMPDGERRGRRWRSLVDEQIRSNGWATAAEVLTAELPAEALSRNTLEPIAEAGMASDPDRVAGFLSKLPADHAAEAMPAFIARWAERDYNAAGQWLNASAGTAPWRDRAVALLEEKIAPLDAAAARAWAATITAPAVRQTLK